MKTIRLIAIDLDDTLLCSDLSISGRVKSAVKKAEVSGIKVVLASGRIPVSMKHYCHILGLHKRPGYIICSNGSVIQETHTEKIIHEATIEPNVALAVCDLAGAEGFPVQLYEDGVIYVSKQNEYTRIDQKLTGLRQVVVENFRTMIGGGTHKLIIPGDPMLLSPLESLLKTYFGNDISLFTSRPYMLEILPRKTDKGTALERISLLLNISADETMAIGDSMNDEAMIRWAGTGVAMANADERIKQIAGFVTEGNNDEDGVAEVIERLLAGKEISK